MTPSRRRFRCRALGPAGRRRSRSGHGRSARRSIEDERGSGHERGSRAARVARPNASPRFSRIEKIERSADAPSKRRGRRRPRPGDAASSGSTSSRTFAGSTSSCSTYIGTAESGRGSSGFDTNREHETAPWRRDGTRTRARDRRGDGTGKVAHGGRTFWASACVPVAQGVGPRVRSKS